MPIRGRLIVLTVVSIVVLSACGSAQPSGGPLTGTLAAIKSSGTLRDCIDPEFPPEIYLKDGQPAGIAADLVQAMATSLKVKVNFVQTNFPGLIAGLQANKCDVAFSGVTARATRAESATFAKNYLLLVLGLAVPNTETRASIDDFNKAGVKICTVEGTADQAAIKSSFPQATEVPLQDINSCFLQLTTGKVDGFIVDNSTGGLYAQQHPNSVKMILTESGGLQAVPSAIAVRYGDYELRDWINVFMAELIDSGGYTPIYQANFGTAPDIQQLLIERGGF
jgi:polar amino acid transport system substrate-binding protein